MPGPNVPDPLDLAQRNACLDIRFGGVLMLAALTEIDGVSTEDKWKEQASKEASGSTNAFSGTKYGHPELTFVATTSAEWASIVNLWNALAPVPGLGQVSTQTPSASTAPTQVFAIGSPAPQPTGFLGQVQSAIDTVSKAVKDASDPSGAATSGSTTPDPGPRPPTISVDYWALRLHGITAVAREKWDGPYFTETNGVRVKIKFIPDKPPVPAGAGAMAPPPAGVNGSQFQAQGGAAGGAGAGQGAPAGGSSASTAAAGAAGT